MNYILTTIVMDQRSSVSFSSIDEGLVFVKNLNPDSWINFYFTSVKGELISIRCHRISDLNKFALAKVKTLANRKGIILNELDYIFTRDPNEQMINWYLQLIEKEMSSVDLINKYMMIDPVVNISCQLMEYLQILRFHESLCMIGDDGEINKTYKSLDVCNKIQSVLLIEDVFSSWNQIEDLIKN